MWAHRVALETGSGFDVDGIMEAMSFRQLAEWCAYFEIQNEEASKAADGKAKPSGPKRHVTPEMADAHMRVWATQFKTRKVRA
jgi:hypothetical protein